jgi:hypothetical protein
MPTCKVKVYLGIAAKKQSGGAMMKRKPQKGKGSHTQKKVTQHNRGSSDEAEPSDSDSEESEHRDRRPCKKPKRFQKSDVEEVHGEETDGKSPSEGATEVIDIEADSEV